MLLITACGSPPPPAAPPVSAPPAMTDAAPIDAAPMVAIDAAAAMVPVDAPVAPVIARPVAATDCRGVRVVTKRYLETRDLHAEPAAIDGVPKVHLVCTARACPSTQPCCNGCGGGYRVMLDPATGVSLLGFEGCTGMDCNYKCTPFGNQPKQRYRFVGTLDGYNQLSVTKYCKL
jgi:hypothetical protein